MERKKSFVDELFPTNKMSETAKYDNPRSIFPTYTVAGKASVHSDWRKTGDNHSLVSPLGKSQSTAKKNGKHASHYEFTESCLMSSSIHYGGRDDFITDTSGTYNSGPHYHNKKNKEDDSVNSEAAMRGDWWQGSFYY